MLQIFNPNSALFWYLDLIEKDPFFAVCIPTYYFAFRFTQAQRLSTCQKGLHCNLTCCQLLRQVHEDVIVLTWKQLVTPNGCYTTCTGTLNRFAVHYLGTGRTSQDRSFGSLPPYRERYCSAKRFGTTNNERLKLGSEATSIDSKQQSTLSKYSRQVQYEATKNNKVLIDALFYRNGAVDAFGTRAQANSTAACLPVNVMRNQQANQIRNINCCWYS